MTEDLLRAWLVSRNDAFREVELAYYGFLDHLALFNYT